MSQLCRTGARVPRTFLAGPSSGLKTSPTFLVARNYATVLKDDPTPKEPREYPHRKAHVFAKYVSLLKDSPALILLKQENFTIGQLTQLRRDLFQATVKLNKQAQKKREAIGLGEGEEKELSAKLTVLRPGILVPAVRQTFGRNVTTRLRPLLKGQVTALVLPTLDPPHLMALLRILDKVVPPAPPQSAQKGPKAGAVDEFDTKEKPKQLPQLSLLGAFVDGKVILTDGVRDAAKLPPLETLRAQIVGLLSAPASKLAQVIGMASGGDIARTLEGFKKGLEMEAEEQGSSSPKEGSS